MSHTVVLPELVDSSAGLGRWMVVIFDNDYNSRDEVVEILMKATGCDAEEAHIEMWEADTYGKAPVHFAAADECRKVSQILGTIGLVSEVLPEWQD
jgi:ATP-dependent Clp protease adaptor protein ClpS